MEGMEKDVLQNRAREGELEKSGLKLGTDPSAIMPPATTYSGKKFTKMKGFAKTDGPMYEVKVAALLFLRCKNSERVRRFQLAVNLQGAGALDDVVLRYTLAAGQPARWYTCFVQLKHKQRAALSLASMTAPAGDFSLVKYLKSVVDIENAMSTASDVSDPFGGSFEDACFVLYTNAVTNIKPTRCVESDLPELTSLLGADSEVFKNEKIFCLGRDDRRKIVAILEKTETKKDEDQSDVGRETFEYTSAKLEKALERMVMFSGQPTVKQLDDVIKRELLLLSYKEPTSFNVDQLYPIYVELFGQWWANSEYLLDETESSDVLHEALARLRDESRKEDRVLLDVNFRDAAREGLRLTFPDGVSVLLVASEGGSVRLCYSKVVRLLERRRTLFASRTLGELSKNRGSLSTLLSSGNTLVVVDDSSGRGKRDWLLGFAKDLDKILRSVSGGRVIVVSLKTSDVVGYLQELLGKKCLQLNTSFHLGELDERSFNRVLQKDIIFQGQELNPMKLESFFRGNMEFAHDVLKDDIVESILTSHRMSIGPELEDVVDFYIGRTLKSTDVLKRAILDSIPSTEVVEVTGVTSRELAALAPPLATIGRWDDEDVGRCQIIEADSRSGDERAIPNKYVHLLGLNDSGDLKWIASQGNISFIRRGIVEEQHSTYRPETVLSMDARVTLLIAEPGMGKSTLLSHLAQETKERNPDLWVLRVNLNDHTDLLDGSPCDDAVRFLCSVVGGGGRTSLEDALLRLSLERVGDCVVLLDGFDEIAPSYTRKGLALVTSLLRTRVRRVWVTARHSVKDVLEEHLSCLAFNLQSFSELDQRTFFKKFWKNRTEVSSISDDDRDDFITELLKRLADTLADNDKLLPGIPLQTMILAEVFAGHSSIESLPEKLDLLYLFETFIDKKFKIFVEEKLNIFSKNLTLPLQTLRDKFELDHMYSALVVLVPRDLLAELHSHGEILEQSGQFFQYVQDANDKSGIVYTIRNKQPIFIHRTFAEFFAAKWFCKYHRLNRKFLIGRLFTVDFGVVRNMFDRLLAKGLDLHTAILNDDVRRVEALLSSTGVDVDSADLGGRSALHLAAAVGFESKRDGGFDYSYADQSVAGPRPRHLVELVLERGVNVNLVDTALEWTPLEYSLHTETWDAMEYLLAGQANGDLLVLSKTSLTNRSLTDLIISHGFLNLLTFFLDRGLSANFIVDNTYRLLHLAASRGQLQIVQLLVSRRADVRVPEATYGDYPLHNASRRGHLSVVRALLASGKTFRLSSLFLSLKSSNLFHKQVNLRNAVRETALHLAADYGSAELVEFLVSHGANVKARDEEGKTSLHRAATAAVARVLLESVGPNGDAVVKYVDIPDEDGRSALSWASERGHSDVVRLLTARGGHPDSLDKKGRTCLHWGSKGGNLSVVQTLVESLGPDGHSVARRVNAPDLGDRTALALASGGGFSDVVRLLLAHGGDARLRDKKGKTCLHRACKARSPAVARVLVASLGEDEASIVSYLAAENRDGETARDVAVQASSRDAYFDLESDRAVLVEWLDQSLEKYSHVA